MTDSKQKAINEIAKHMAKGTCYGGGAFKIEAEKIFDIAQRHFQPDAAAGGDVVQFLMELAEGVDEHGKRTLARDMSWKEISNRAKKCLSALPWYKDTSAGDVGGRSQGSCEFAYFCKEDGSPIETNADVAETLAASAMKNEKAELWGVTMGAPDHVVICYTGNGPTSKANAAFIAKAFNASLPRAPHPIPARRPDIARAGQDAGAVTLEDLKPIREALDYCKKKTQYNSVRFVIEETEKHLTAFEARVAKGGL